MAKKKKGSSVERQQRLIRFREEILPELQTIYDVEVHGPKNAPGSMYKIIIHTLKSYDYYPMAEKMRIDNNGIYTWKDFTIDQMSAAIKHLSMVR